MAVRTTLFGRRHNVLYGMRWVGNRTIFVLITIKILLIIKHTERIL